MLYDAHIPVCIKKKTTHTPYETDPVVSFYLDIYFLISQKAFRENCAAYLSCLLT